MGLLIKWLLLVVVLFSIAGPDPSEAQVWAQDTLWNIYVRDQQKLLRKRQGEATTEPQPETTSQIPDEETTTLDPIGDVSEQPDIEDDTNVRFVPVGDRLKPARPKTDGDKESEPSRPLALRISLPELIEVGKDFEKRPPCGATFAISSFTLLPPIAKLKGDCNFTIEKQVPQVCKVHLKFNKFELPGNDEDCTEGFRIGDQILCGNLTGKSKEVIFDSNSKELEISVNLFEEDISQDDNFYNITIRQIVCPPVPQIGSLLQEPELDVYTRTSLAEPKVDGPRVSEDPNSCNQNIDDEEFLVQSPSYPDDYPSNTNCITTVFPSGKNICSLELRFDEFRVEPSDFIDDCENDYLEINDDEPFSQPLRYCGIFAGVRLVEMGRLKRFVFHSNGQNSDSGYSIFVKQLPCRGVPTEEATTLPSTTPFTTPSTTSATAGGRTSTTSYDDGSYYPSLPVYTDTPEIAILPPNPQILERHPTKPKYCSRTYLLSDTPERLTSPNFPARYLDNESCDYYLEVTRSDVCFIKFNFNTFSLRGSVGCRDDYLEISGNRICGSQSGSLLFPIDRRSKTTKLTFKTNPDGRGEGFDLEVTQVPCHQEQRNPTDILIIGSDYGTPGESNNPIFNSGSQSESSYGSPDGQVFPVESGYGSPIGPVIDGGSQPGSSFPILNDGSGYGSPTGSFQPQDTGTLQPGSGYGSPIGSSFPVPIGGESQPGSSYGSPTGFNPIFSPGSSTQTKFPNQEFQLVDDQPANPSGEPPLSVDLIFYGSTQNSAFGSGSKKPKLAIDPVFRPSSPILGTTQDSHSSNNPQAETKLPQNGFNGGGQVIVAGSNGGFNNVPNSQVLVVEDVDSYGAPVGPIISVFDPQRPEPEIITGRPDFNLSPEFDQHSIRPQLNDPVIVLDSSRPNYVNPISTESRPSYINPVITNPNFQGFPILNEPKPTYNTNQPFNPTIIVSDDGYGAPQAPVFGPSNGPSRPNFNPGTGNTDSYGAPLAPVLPVLPPHEPSRPNFNPGPEITDGYGAPQAPVLPSRPTYGPSRPSYNPGPGKKPNFLGPLASIIDAKRQAVANIFSGFRTPKNIGLPRPKHPRPSGRRPAKDSSFKLPFGGGFHFGKPNLKSRPSYNRPSSDYGAPLGPILISDSRPTYEPTPFNRRPQRKIQTISTHQGDDDDKEEIPTLKCGETEAPLETFAKEFIFKSPNYPDNYPDSFNCSIYVFPRKDVCALSLQLEDFILEDSAYCHSDFISIGARDDQNRKRICGQQSYKIIELVSPENLLEPWAMEFQADSSGHQRGFSIHATQIPCIDLDLSPLDFTDFDNCGVNSVSEISGTVSSHFMEKEDVCLYQIEKIEGYCSVTLIIEGLAPGSNCEGDLVEVDRTEFCIVRQKENSIHEFPFGESGVMDIRFRQSNLNQSKDWKITYQQQLCPKSHFQK